MPLVTAVIDPDHALMTRRRALVEQLAAVDHEIAAEAAASLREALRTATTVSAMALPAAEPTKLLPQRTPRRRGEHDASARGAALIVAHEHEIKTALVAGPLSAKAIAHRARMRRDDVKRALKQLLPLGRVVKNGNRGPSVTWQLAAGTASTAAASSRRETTGRDDAFETVWPPKDNPRAPLSSLLQPGAPT